MSSASPTHSSAAAVALADTRTGTYALGPDRDPAIGRALATVAAALGWSNGDQNLFGRVIEPGARVLVKPNLVLHENEGPWGIDPLVTHSSIIRTVVEAALAANPSRVVVGDAPIQSCDFERLVDRTGLGAWAASLAARESRFAGIRDFRRTTCVVSHGVRVAAENVRPEDQFVLFDLGRESLLEPITDSRHGFRVAWYDPRLMARTHRAGQHQYLLARDVLEADIVINLPKLKTHKKAGITCALKNLIGINGNKEFLPHHRVGGAATGGDCYPSRSAVKRALEYIADRRNETGSRTAATFWYAMTLALTRILRVKGDRLGFEGSWSGNDTIWRTCLDLNRILVYGRADGTIADIPQRRVIHVVDAVIAGHGDGPLAPQALPLGLLMGGNNPAAVDWVGAHLLAYDVDRIPIVREAFGRFRWPLTDFPPADITVAGDVMAAGGDLRTLGARALAAGIQYPIGWRDAALQAPRIEHAA
jgi:uncharacterized protein (DUF362 family)